LQQKNNKKVKHKEKRDLRNTRKCSEQQRRDGLRIEASKGSGMYLRNTRECGEQQRRDGLRIEASKGSGMYLLEVREGDTRG
jgi:predicted nucleic acid-binding Zn ribbon protein